LLRITRDQETAAAVTLKLEGRLTEPWAMELERVATAALHNATGLVVDLSGLSFADRVGTDLLRALSARGARLRGGSSFVTALLEGDHT
jgi:anti-anti-sigma regulatory factor